MAESTGKQLLSALTEEQKRENSKGAIKTSKTAKNCLEKETRKHQSQSFKSSSESKFFPCVVHNF